MSEEKQEGIITDDSGTATSAQQAQEVELDASAQVESDDSNEQSDVETTSDESLKVAKETPAPVVAKKKSDSDDDESQEEEPEAFEIEHPDPDMRWYIVHAQSMFEAKAKQQLEERVIQAGKQADFGHILIPVESVVELVKGKKKSSQRKFFPGYMLIQMKLTETNWHIVKGTPRITGFVGHAQNPPPLPLEEVERITSQMREGLAKARPKFTFKEGDNVRVIDGPFANFNGTVEEVKPEKSKLRVLVSIFGRATPVELDFIQVEKT